MSSYFIATSDEQGNGSEGWSLDSKEFADALNARWPEISISHIEDVERDYSLEWSLTIGDTPIEGMLDRNGRVVILDGDVADCAEFALWYRSIVPNDQELQFFDEGYSGDIEIKHDTTKQELIDAIPDE